MINVLHCTQTVLAMQPTYHLSATTVDSSSRKHHHRQITTSNRALLTKYRL